MKLAIAVMKLRALQGFCANSCGAHTSSALAFRATCGYRSRDAKAASYLLFTPLLRFFMGFLLI